MGLAMRWCLRAALILLAAGSPAARGGDPGTRIGVLLAGEDEDARQASLAYFAAGLDAAASRRPEVEVLSRHVDAADEAGAAAAIEEMRVAGVEVLVAFGDEAARRARPAVRSQAVVFAAVDPASAAELRRGGNACVAAGASPAQIVADLRRASPSLKRVGVYVPAGDEAARANAADLGAETEVVIAEGTGATAFERAGAALAKLLPGADAVWLPPSVSGEEAAAMARMMQSRGVPLVGSRAAHLRAGCAIVVRADPHDLGALAAVLVRQVLARTDPAKIVVRRTSRRLLEVNLPSAKRLAWRPSLSLLAWADTILRSREVPR